MTIDEKDLEIARLKGKVEALESELAKERALRILAPVTTPTFVPYPVARVAADPIPPRSESLHPESDRPDGAAHLPAVAL